jgi:AcrR family transcriptional regulator
MGRLKDLQPGEKLWAEFGFRNKPSVRQQMLALTVVRVGERGPEVFSTNVLAKELGVVPGTINYHFGSREALIAKASVLGYKRYVERIWEKVNHEKKDPEKRLCLWLEESVEIQFQMHGWGPIFNFPASAKSVTEILNKKFSRQLEEFSELNMSRLNFLVEDLRKNKVREYPYTLGKVPRDKLLLNIKLIQLTASIGWSCLGLAVWHSGRHLPSKQLSLKSTLTKQLMKTHFDNIIALVKLK